MQSFDGGLPEGADLAGVFPADLAGSIDQISPMQVTPDPGIELLGEQDCPVVPVRRRDNFIGVFGTPFR